MTADRVGAILAECQARGVRLWAEGGRIAYRTLAGGGIPPNLASRIKEVRGVILAHLQVVDLVTSVFPGAEALGVVEPREDLDHLLLQRELDAHPFDPTRPVARLPLGEGGPPTDRAPASYEEQEQITIQEVG